MLKRINNILNIVIGANFGSFIGYAIYEFWDFKARPGLYAMLSAPWYAGVLIHGMVTAVVLIVSVIIKLTIRLRHPGHFSKQEHFSKKEVSSF